MSNTNSLRAALANAHNALELYHAYGWPDRGGVRAALRVQIDALAATQQPAPSAPEQPSAAVEAACGLTECRGRPACERCAPSEPLRVGALSDWKIERKGEAITVCHDVIGGYAATEQDTNIASTVLYHLAATVLATQPTSAAADVDALAQFIRSIDGRNSMGAGVLAEHICEWLATTPEGKQ